MSNTHIGKRDSLDDDGYLTLDGMILRPDGSESYRHQMRAPIDQAAALGAALGSELLGLAGGRKFLAR